MSNNVKFEQIVKIVNEFSALGESRGLGKLYTDDKELDGKSFTINGSKYVNLGSCSYLGLELDNRLKKAAIDAINKYGSLFSCSRIYVSSGNYKELEELTERIFNSYILLTSTVTLGHQCVMPIIIGSNDLVIYDQQAHISMHEIAYKLSHYGTVINILRHNRLDELELRIEANKDKFDKIWYIIDGVFSMFGDLAPVKEIIGLLNKHKKLWLYIDDAHGVSWAGPNGSGYVLSQAEQHPKMILGTSMAKGFGSCGGVFSFKDREMRDKVKHWGGPLAYSGPQEPATVAAAIASAKIHLSSEIYDLQKQLREKISYCNDLMIKNRIPLVSVSESPIFFIACGLPLVGFELVERLMTDGFYSNIGIFPAVPETCTGVRFTLTNHIDYDDIERLVRSVAFHYPKALASHDRTIKDVYRAFRKFSDFESRYGNDDQFKTESMTFSEEKFKSESGIRIKQFKSIKDIDPNVWNELLGERGSFDHQSLIILENAFSDNLEPENNWKFYYYIVYENDKILAATFFTSTLIKDDMLSPEKISVLMEEKRMSDPYFLTSGCVMMGSLLTNGDHLYVNMNSKHWEEALTMILNAIWRIQDNSKANSVYLRDFCAEDTALSAFFINHGFIKIDSLDNNVIENINFHSFEDYQLKKLSSKKRYQIKNEALVNFDKFELRINDNELNTETLFNMYLNVKRANLSLNTFALPKKLFEVIKQESNWEILTLHRKDNLVPVAMSMCLKTENNYSHVLFGIDNSLEKSDRIYKLMIYHVVKRAFELKSNNLFMGITASDTKRKFGASQIRQIAFIQVKDRYNQDYLDSLSFA